MQRQLGKQVVATLEFTHRVNATLPLVITTRSPGPASPAERGRVQSVERAAALL